MVGTLARRPRAAAALVLAALTARPMGGALAVDAVVVVVVVVVAAAGFIAAAKEVMQVDLVARHRSVRAAAAAPEVAPLNGMVNS